MLHSQTTIRPIFISLLNTILSGNYWKEKGNQTALVFLLTAWRVDGLKLLTSMVTVLPLPVLQPFLPAVMGKLVEIASVALGPGRHA